MTATDRLKAAWERALADPSAVVDAAMTRPEVQAALIGWLPNQTNLEKVDWETVLRETEKGTAAWCAVQILALDDASEAVGTYGNQPAGPRCHACDREYHRMNCAMKRKTVTQTTGVICKHLTKLGRSPDRNRWDLPASTLIVEAMPGPATIRDASPFCLKKRGSLPRFDRVDENEVRELPNPPSEDYWQMPHRVFPFAPCRAERKRCARSRYPRRACRIPARSQPWWAGNRKAEIVMSSSSERCSSGGATW